MFHYRIFYIFIYIIIAGNGNLYSYKKSLVHTFVFLINIFLINPLGKALSKAADSLYDNETVKIFALDLIDNPLTFLRLAKVAVEKNKIDNARLYLRYCEILLARFNYPENFRREVLELKSAINQKN